MCFTESSLPKLNLKLSEHYFILATMSYDFISAGPFSNTDRETGFHAAKSFDSVLCTKLETMTFLVTRKGQDNTKKYSPTRCNPMVLVSSSCPV